MGFSPCCSRYAIRTECRTIKTRHGIAKGDAELALFRHRGQTHHGVGLHMILPWQVALRRSRIYHGVGLHRITPWQAALRRSRFGFVFTVVASCRMGFSPCCSLCFATEGTETTENKSNIFLDSSWALWCILFLTVFLFILLSCLIFYLSYILYKLQARKSRDFRRLSNNSPRSLSWAKPDLFPAKAQRRKEFIFLSCLPKTKN